MGEPRRDIRVTSAETVNQPREGVQPARTVYVLGVAIEQGRLIDDSYAGF
jgi:hypothetical protein